MDIYESAISSKGQLTLPKKLREKYHLKEGETALVVAMEEGILVKHMTVSLRGMLRGKIDLEEFEKNVRESRKGWRL